MKRAAYGHGAAMLGVALAAWSIGCSSSDNNGSSGDQGVTGAGATGAGASSSAGAGGGQAGAGGAGTAASNGTSGTSGTNGTSGTSGTGTGAGTGAGGFQSGGAGAPTAACPGLPFESTDAGADASTSCAGVSTEAEHVDVDMYIMMDRSVSMAEQVGTTGKIRWDFVHDAVQKFVQDPRAANIGMGIQFFGQSGSKDDAIDCDVSRYATPAVGIGPAGTVGANIVSAISATLPGGLTPLLPALQGAVQYGKQWATGHPGRATVVVLVTDGYPTQCQNPVSIEDITAVAQTAATGTPPVRTYAIGLPAGYNLDNIARAGGTNAAFKIDEGDITNSFVTTLLNISASPLACEYQIPAPTDPNQALDPSKVQVVYSPAVGNAEEIPRADSGADCATSVSGGWYYDNPSNPSKILVCPCTCSRFAAGTVDIRLGCQPRHIPLH